MKRIMCILALFFCLTVSTFAGERFSATVMRVVDGDTFRVWDGERETVIRLMGVDTPEASANRKARSDAERWDVSVDEIVRAGKRAAFFVSSVAPSGIQIGIEANGDDEYGRTLAYVYLPDGRSLNEIIIRTGCGIARYRHEREPEYKEIERLAQNGNRGFWPTLWRNMR